MEGYIAKFVHVEYIFDNLYTCEDNLNCSVSFICVLSFEGRNFKSFLFIL